jgi:rhamnose utilization protein RhaD (predicted bifunctional aldolase and dehydrogenase)
MQTLYEHLGPQTKVALAEISKLSVELGSDPTLIQGAGGNSSIKIDDVLWIKASGKWLAHALREPVFVPVSLSGVRARVDVGEADPVGQEKLNLVPHTTLRPSIETSLHALMPHRIVMHVHSVAAIAFSVCQNGQALLEEYLAHLNWAWVPYAKPGVQLTEAVKCAIHDTDADILVLANHGLVVGADSIELVNTLLMEIESRLQTPPRELLTPDLATLQAYSQRTEYEPAEDAALHALALDPRQLEIVTAGTLYPDHVVFLGAGVHALPAGRALPEFLEELKSADVSRAPLILVPGAGVLVHHDITPAESAMVGCLAAVAARIPLKEPVEYLSNADVWALLDWEAETYRKSLARERQ